MTLQLPHGLHCDHCLLQVATSLCPSINRYLARIGIFEIQTFSTWTVFTFNFCSGLTLVETIGASVLMARGELDVDHKKHLELVLIYQFFPRSKVSALTSILFPPLWISQTHLIITHQTFCHLLLMIPALKLKEQFILSQILLVKHLQQYQKMSTKTTKWFIPLNHCQLLTTVSCLQFLNTSKGRK